MRAQIFKGNGSGTSAILQILVVLPGN